MNTPAAPLALQAGQRAILDRVARSQTAPHRQVQRAQALLLAADGVPNTRIATQVGVTVVTVRAWRTQFAASGLKDWEPIRPGRGRKPSIPAATVQVIVDATWHQTPPDGATQWSLLIPDPIPHPFQ